MASRPQLGSYQHRQDANRREGGRVRNGHALYNAVQMLLLKNHGRGNVDTLITDSSQVAKARGRKVT